MKRVLLIASALCIGIAAFVINTNPGITQAQTAASVAAGARPGRFRRRPSSIRTRRTSKPAPARG